MADELTELTPVAPEPEWVERFLAHYRKCGVVAWSAEVAGVTRQCVYKRRKEHPEFDERVKEAEPEAVDWIEAAAVKTAIEGANPQLLMFLLRCRKRDVYGDAAAKVVVSGDPAAPVKHDHTHSLAGTIDHLAAAFAAAADRQGAGGLPGDGAG